MDKPAKPSLSQQLLRSLRPRAVSSTTTATSSFLTSAAASPSISALDSTSTVSTPDVAFDVLFAKTAGPFSQRALYPQSSPHAPASASTEAASSPTSATSSPQSKQREKIDPVSHISAKPADTLTRADFMTLIQELQKTTPPMAPPESNKQSTAGTRDLITSSSDEEKVQRDVQCLRILISSLKRTADSEQKVDDESAEWDESQTLQQGPPQAEVFKLCLLLLGQQEGGALLPLPIRLGACELLTVSVRLSDMRAARTIKAVRETRSGAPGSQSNKAADADQPLANIDRAALYALVRNLSSRSEGALPTKENHYATRLPALPLQLRALDVLSQQGRDVVSFPGILDFLSEALEAVWQELQMLRGFATETAVNPERPTREQTDARNADHMALTEQLSIREWSVLSLLALITSILKFSFAKLELLHIEYMLECLTHAMCYAPPAADSKDHAQPSRRARSKDKRPLLDGYDYYGLDAIGSDSPTPIATPKGGHTPRIGPRIVNEPGSAIAPIALATVAPSSASIGPEKSVVNVGTPILHDTEVAAVAKLVDSVLRFGFMPPASVDDACRLLCSILGYQTNAALEASKKHNADYIGNAAKQDPDMPWAEVMKPVVANLLRSHCANAALRSVRNLLVERHPGESIHVLCGAVDFLQCAVLLSTDEGAQRSSGPSKTSDDALMPSLSVPLLMPALEGALKRHNDALDLRVLDLVSEYLPLSESRTAASEGLSVEDWEMLLSLPAAAKRHLQDWHFTFGNNPLDAATSRNQLPVVIVGMVKLLSELRLASPSSIDANEALVSNRLPWTPRLARLFLSLAPVLPDEKACMLVEYYQAGHLCLPCTADWLDNIRALLGAFFSTSTLARGLAATLADKAPAATNAISARRKVAQLVFQHVYGTVHDLPAYRNSLLQEILLPLSTSTLVRESDAEIEDLIRRVIIEAAVTSATHARVIADPSVEMNGIDEDGRIFLEVMSLHVKLATGTELAGPASQPRDGPQRPGAHITFADPPGAHEHKAGGHGRSRSIGAGHYHGVSATKESGNLLGARAIRSVLDLIAIFDRLAFSSPWVLLSTSSKHRLSEEAQRAAWERQARNACLYIFRILLDMVRPPGQSESAEGPDAGYSTHLQVRLTVLQWLMRLRTDGEHRVYIAGDMDELVGPAASAIARGPRAQAEDIPELGEDRARSRPAFATGKDDAREGGDRVRTAAERSASRARDSSRERGRRDVSAERGDRFRSQSRQRPAVAPVAKPTYLGEPLWRVPETIPFNVPSSGWRSDVVFTYMHTGAEGDNECQHDHLHNHASAHRSGEVPIPLPISEFLSVCITLLTNEEEWELVSYVLCHLPHQLANKHLVCGPKAQVQIVALRQVLVSSILEQRFLNQVALPEEVKKSDVYALSYSTLATLVSYRSLFSRSQQDEIVEAFMAGLNKSSNTAQPCIRALSIACYELQKSINRHLPKMLVRLSTVMSSSAMSVHILELIASIGNLPSLYANFTETEYRRIFGIALQYIQYHHQRHSEEDMRSSATAFTLSQYVIMLAYYNVSLWYIIVKRSDRPNYVESIRKGLLIANEGRAKVADQTEVCFDFLARFTHSDADARPQKSYLNHVVGAKGISVTTGGSTSKSNGMIAKHYLQGNALLTVTALDKPGWAEILIRRPSGTAGMLCKLENVLVPQLPESDGERLDRSAAHLMNRNVHPHAPGNEFEVQARRSLASHESRLARRPLGPAIPGRKGRARAKSQSSTSEMLGPVKVLRRTEPDSYSLAADIDENGQILAPGSLELQETMRKVLGDDGGQATDAKGTEKKKETDNLDKVKSQQPLVRQEALFDPGFIALQLSAFPDTSSGGKQPFLLPDEKWVERSIRAIDLTPVVDFHKIGVLYVGSGQSDEREILANRTGSRRYAQFLSGLGDLVTLRGQQDVYTGGLDIHHDEHGKYAYVWGDEISQIVFHTTTLMPNDEEHDPNHSRKKALIGNDWVRIVWNESGREYDFDTIKTQFNFINIIISPNSRGGVELGSINRADDIFYRVSLQRIEGLPSFSPIGDGQLVSAAALASFVRILALNCSLVSQIYVSTRGREAGQSFSYTSNWVSRLQHLGRARTRIIDSRNQENGEAASASKKDANGDDWTWAGGPMAATADAPISAVSNTAYDIGRY